MKKKQDPSSHKITDFFSFYSLESSVINNTKHNMIKAAYMFYYATDVVWKDHKDNDEMKKVLKARLNQLVHDALIVAKKVRISFFFSFKENSRY